jgi:hypothetical protein
VFVVVSIEREKNCFGVIAFLRRYSKIAGENCYENITFLGISEKQRSPENNLRYR